MISLIILTKTSLRMSIWRFGGMEKDFDIHKENVEL